MSNENGVDTLTQQLGSVNLSGDNVETRRTNFGTSYISLRDAAETILPFDGKNMPVAQFANSCLHAKNMISPTAEYGLVQMIKNKLVGPALRVALSGEYNDIESLLNVLRTRFAPVYSSSQLHGELAKVTQYPDESVVDYGSRVSMILQQLKSCYQTEAPNQAIQFLTSAENNAVRNFLTGLKSDIYTRIHPHGSATLNNAIESAIRAETDYNEHIQRLRITEGLMQSTRCNNCLGYGHNTNSCSTINPLAQISHVQWQPKICSYCKNPGHVRAECRALQPQILNRAQPRVINRQMPHTHFNNNRLNTPTSRNYTVVCRYCKNPGHTLEECRKRQYNNNLRNRGNQGNQRNFQYNQGTPYRDLPQRERVVENQENRNRAQRPGATLNERPRVRLITPNSSAETSEGTPV